MTQSMNVDCKGEEEGGKREGRGREGRDIYFRYCSKYGKLRAIINELVEETQ